MTPERQARIATVVQNRQGNLTVVLENVHDPHNIGAVLRSCESVGLVEIFVLYSEPHLSQERLALGKKTSAGARKWVDVHFYTDVEACFAHVRSKYSRVWGTHLSEEAADLYALDLTQSVALVFGNEHDGLSKQVLSHCDGNFVIPQMGFVRSLNISVACAVSLYEALRQRRAAGYYGPDNPTMAAERRRALFEEYVRRHDQRSKNRTVPRIK